MAKFKLHESPFLQFLLKVVARTVFSLRYRVEIKGLEQFPSESQGILFLPNHAAYIDNAIFLVYLWPKFKMRPLAGEEFRHSKIIGPFIRLLNGFTIPNLKEHVNAYKIQKSNEVLQEIVQGLKSGGNFMLSPAGHTKSGPKEILGAVSGTHTIVTGAPNANIALMRVTGLWGSSFSRAITGKSPNVPKVLMHGIKVLIQNLIFFTPRRKVVIELELNPPDFPRFASRLELNQYLENWYNRYPDTNGNVSEKEPLKLVSYSFWHNHTLPISSQAKEKKDMEKLYIRPETIDHVYKEIRKILQNPALKISSNMSLAFDLGLDSINLGELSAYLSRHFSVRDIDFENLKTVQDVLNAAEGAAIRSSSIDETNDSNWPSEINRLAPHPSTGKTVPEAFLNICKKLGKSVACRDDIVGVLSYKKLRLASLVLAQYFQTLPNQRIGVMFPASVASFIVFMALQLAGKVPVMLNWTLGSRYIEEMVKMGGVDTIITSWKFLDRASNLDLGNATNKVVFLEDIRRELSLKMKIWGIFLGFLSVPAVFKMLHLKKLNPDSNALILFTSGSESLPKCIPLSHQNLLCTSTPNPFIHNLTSRDSVLAILPPFHIFGLVFAALIPILIGLRVAFFPNPTDGQALVDRIEKWGVSILPTAPTFLKNLLSFAKMDQLKSIRIFASGAEKAPKDLIEKIKELCDQAQLIEGYGSTETAGLISLNQYGEPKRGVGRLFVGTELITIHPETLAPLPPGKEGEICIRSPGVFKGYLGTQSSPFIELDGKQWYRTGDLGYLDEDGYLILQGRLKRFVKFGGEMISLGAVEETLIQSFHLDKRIASQGPLLAICSNKEGSQLIAFSVPQLDKESANEILKRSGFSNLIKISAVKIVDEIPVMSTGKTNYLKLEDLL